MDKVFYRRVQVWKETEAAAHQIGAPPSLKFERSQVPRPTGRLPHATRITVEDIDCLDCASDLQSRGCLPVVLNLSDDLYAGGAVESGSGAQEESLWRRTALCVTQTQEFYPLCGAREEDDYPSIGRARGVVDLIYSTGVPVLRASEAEDYAWLPPEKQWYCDFIACPALKYPVIPPHHPAAPKDILPEDEATLTARLRLILDTAAHMGNDSVVLGAMGCGAWRTPVHAAARVFGTVLPEYDGVFREIVIAILSTHSSAEPMIWQFRNALRLT